jgi:hypothetical protein
MKKIKGLIIFGLIIFYCGLAHAESVQFKIKNGLNLISNPMDQTLHVSALSQFGCRSYPYFFTMKSSKFKVKRSLAPGEGAYLIAYSDCSVHLKGVLAAMPTQELSPGWTIINGAGIKTDIRFLTNQCNIKASYTLDGWYFNRSTTLTPGKTLMVNVGSACRLAAESYPGGN